jgi:hypothetical protein
MRWKELLYERRLKRPLDDQLREAINREAVKRRHEIPVPTEFEWHATNPVLKIKSYLMSFTVSFTPEKLTVFAELSLAAKMLLTEAKRKQAVQFFDAIAKDLDL